MQNLQIVGDLEKTAKNITIFIVFGDTSEQSLILKGILNPPAPKRKYCHRVSNLSGFVSSVEQKG